MPVRLGETEAWELRLFDNEEKHRQWSYLAVERLGKYPDSAEYRDV